ncbi:hypothetical protein KR038_000727 [Drosophila bunnanda]|nr:hypothetical protein KR038_000727 [Drosophila bunnanda]
MLKAASLDNLLMENADLQLSLSEAMKLSHTLQENEVVLQSQLLASNNDSLGLNEKVKELRSELEHALEAKDSAIGELKSLTKDKKALEEQISSLNLSNNLNAELMAKLEAKETESESLREALTHQKLVAEAANDESQKSKEQIEQLRTTMKSEETRIQAEMESMNNTITGLLEDKRNLEENNNLNAELMAKLKAKETETESLHEALTHQKLVAEAANAESQKSKDQIEQLRTTMKSEATRIRAEMERMTNTISSLLEDKRNLEEKQCTLEENALKLKHELSGLQAAILNRPAEPGALLPPPAAVQPGNLDNRRNGGAAVKKSSNMKGAVRRQKRKEAHDEHRMQLGLEDTEESSDEPRLCQEDEEAAEAQVPDGQDPQEPKPDDQ